MVKKLTTNEFITKAKKVHGDFYDYSKVEYINAHTNVCIICPIHGDFLQTPNSHLRGCGCWLCRNKTIGKKAVKKVRGFGVLDILGFSHTNAYAYWHRMLERCYSEEYQSRMPTYKGCSVCEEWLLFSNFLEWFKMHYKEGCELDKDLLVKGNKIYSPNTCCFVPQEINKLIIKNDKKRGDLPIGVSRLKNKYVAHIFYDGKPHTIGVYTTIHDAFNKYKFVKEERIKNIAKKYYEEGKIEKCVYDALMRYEVNIND